MSPEHRYDAIQILSRWDNAMPRAEAARLLERGLREPVNAETAAALLELLDHLAVQLALVGLILDGEIVARANVDPASTEKWIYGSRETAAQLRADLPSHDDVAFEEWGR